MDFDLGLLSQDEPCSVFYDGVANQNDTYAVSSKISDQHVKMEEDEIGLLESSSDLQAFINMASLPEIQGDEDVDVEKVITDVTGFLQNYDTSNCHKQQKLALNYALMSNDEDSKEETAAAVDILDELLRYNDITEEEFAPVLSSEDLPPEEMAAAEDILDELLKSGNMSLDDFDLSSEDVKEEQVEPSTIETLIEEANDSGFIDITNAQHITIDGQDIFIVVAPPSPQPQQELVTSVTAPESLATLSPAHSFAQSDSDWTPDSPKASKGRPPVKRTSMKAKSSRKNIGTPFIKDKKERKKHQNVEAARRYRDKKKFEQENVESEEQALADKNKGLKSEVADLEVKVRTMKQLMVELGILKQA